MARKQARESIPADLDPALTHRIVVGDGHWGKGATLEEAKAKYREHRGKPLEEARGWAIWAVTPETRINEHGSFVMPKERLVQPADVTAE